MTEPSHEPNVPAEAAAIMRMVDFRIPLPWLLGGFIAAVSVMTSMWFQVQRMSDALMELQVTVKAGNVVSSTITGDLALLKYRVEALEVAERAARSTSKP